MRDTQTVLTNDHHRVIEMLPEPMRAARMAFGRSIARSRLEIDLRELLRLRSAQLQGCRH